MLSRAVTALVVLILANGLVADEGISRQRLVDQLGTMYHFRQGRSGQKSPEADASLKVFRAELAAYAEKRLPATLPAAAAPILKYGTPADRRIFFGDADYLRLKAREAIEYVVPATEFLQRFPPPSQADLGAIDVAFRDFERLALKGLGGNPAQASVDAVRSLVRRSHDAAMGEASDPYSTFGKRFLSEAQIRQIDDELAMEFRDTATSTEGARQDRDAISACQRSLGSLRSKLEALTTDKSSEPFARSLRTPELEATVRELEQCEAKLRTPRP